MIRHIFESSPNKFHSLILLPSASFHFASQFCLINFGEYLSIFFLFFFFFFPHEFTSNSSSFESSHNPFPSLNMTLLGQPSFTKSVLSYKLWVIQSQYQTFSHEGFSNTSVIVKIRIPHTHMSRFSSSNHRARQSHLIIFGQYIYSIKRLHPTHEDSSNTSVSVNIRIPHPCQYFPHPIIIHL